MSQAKFTLRPWFLLPMMLVGVHTVLVVVAPLGGGGTHADTAGLVWVLFYYLDYPASLLMPVTDVQPEIFFLLLGIVYWGSIGFLIQAAWNRLCRSQDTQK